ncbi:UPF0718 protein YcgR, partial [Durusdinium trenchii]
QRCFGAMRASAFGAILWASLRLAWGHDSCCAKAAALGGRVEAAKVMVPDMNAQKPDAWDEDEDGPWERPLVPKVQSLSAHVLWIWVDELWNNLEDASPWLLLGLLCSGTLKSLFSDDLLQRFLPSGPFGPTVTGALVGLFSPFCSCSSLPMSLTLLRTGAPCSAVVAFIVSSQAAGLDSLLFTMGVLGLRVALLRCGAALLLGIAAGSVVDGGGRGSLPDESRSQCSGQQSKSWTPLKLWETFTEDFEEILGSVLLGFALTSLLTALLPAGGLGTVASVGGPFSLSARAAVLAVALPLQFCEHAAVPLAVALQKAGATGGLAFATLASLPAINSASLAFIAHIAGGRSALQVLLSVWLFGMVLSYLADWAQLELLQVGHSEEGLPAWFVKLSKPLMGVISLGSLWRIAGHRWARDTKSRCKCKES